MVTVTLLQKRDDRGHKSHSIMIMIDGGKSLIFILFLFFNIINRARIGQNSANNSNQCVLNIISLTLGIVHVSVVIEICRMFPFY